MPRYSYTGTDATTAANRQGTIEAASERDAANELRLRGVVPATIKATSPPQQQQRTASVAPSPPDNPHRPVDIMIDRSSSTWIVGIGGAIIGVTGLAAASLRGQDVWLCSLVGLLFLGAGVLCMLHIVIADATQSKAARKLQTHQCQQLATLIEQNRQLIEAIEQQGKNWRAQ